MLSERSKTRSSPTGSRSSSPPLQRCQPVNSVPKNLQLGEHMILNSVPQLSSRVQRKPLKTKQPRSTSRNTYSSLNEEVPVNERVFAQAQALAEKIDLRPSSRSLRESQIDITYALARYLNSERKARRNAPKDLEISRWGATVPTSSSTQGTPSPFHQGQFSILSAGPTSPAASHQQNPAYISNKTVAHTGAQFVEEHIDTDAVEAQA
ncbi:uncharacterized protein DFL_003494 [Arthrobotrys flagrans]|uniref:Uncharacterized protein n=1 Tax=Arthrobotrys flagrans TaxID=97331 RepID=A0A437A1Z3_ARTFL|nr:hypothetical protein DFL_003494 [Arthrobotrys flagrans]